MSATVNTLSLPLRKVGPEGAQAPLIAIPDEIFAGDEDEIEFKIGTDQGNILVQYSHYGLVCRGSIEALTSFGLFREEWVPRPESLTNKTRQAVLFDKNGVHAVIGRFDRSKLNPADDLSYLIVVRSGSRFHVEVAPTAEQKKKILAHREKCWAKDEHQKQQCGTGRDASLDPSDPDDRALVVKVCAKSADDVLEELHAHATKPAKGMKYSEESEARILRLIGELRNAYREANVVATAPTTSKIPRRGNVVCWPGSGKITAVPLSALC